MIDFFIIFLIKDVLEFGYTLNKSKLNLTIVLLSFCETIYLIFMFVLSSFVELDTLVQLMGLLMVVLITSIIKLKRKKMG